MKYGLMKLQSDEEYDDIVRKKPGRPFSPETWRQSFPFVWPFCLVTRQSNDKITRILRYCHWQFMLSRLASSVCYFPFVFRLSYLLFADYYLYFIQNIYDYFGRARFFFPLSAGYCIWQRTWLSCMWMLGRCTGHRDRPFDLLSILMHDYIIKNELNFRHLSHWACCLFHMTGTCSPTHFQSLICSTRPIWAMPKYKGFAYGFSHKSDQLFIIGNKLRFFNQFLLSTSSPSWHDLWIIHANNHKQLKMKWN